MRLLATGDSQFGVATVELADQEAVWDRTVDAVIEHQVDALLHAGDLFEHAHVSNEVHAAFRRPLARLREAGIPMLLIRGNHDGAVRPVDAVDVFSDYPGLTVSQRPEVIPLAGVSVATLPWVSPAKLIAEIGATVERDRVNEYAAELLVQVAGDLLADAPADEPTILLAHWSISGSSLPTGLPVDQLREPVLPWADLDALGFDLVIAGHIHKAQQLHNFSLGDATPGFYVGSPQPLNHGEPGEHGCWLVNIEPGAVSLEFLPIESKAFVTHDLDLVTDRGIFDLAHLPPIGDGAVVRVRYRATAAQARTLDHAAMRCDLLDQGASRVTFEPQIERATRARSEALTDQMGPLKALHEFVKAEQVEPRLAERMGERLREWIEA